MLRTLSVVLTLVVSLASIAPAHAQMPTTKVVVQRAKIIDARATITLVATVEPLRRSRVSSEIAGLITEMPAREGDLIQRGGVIAKLNDDTRSLALAAEMAKLANLRSRHEELLAGTRKEELRRFKALLDEAIAEDDRWEFEMARIEGLRTRGTSNEKEFEDTKANYLAAERRRIAAEAAYNLAAEGPRAEVKAQARYDVDEQQAVVDRMAADLRKTIINAPFGGHIVERQFEIGEWINVGDPLVEMLDLSSVLVRLDAPESALPYLVVGDAARVKIDALKRTFEGHIKRIMRKADPNARTFPVQIEVANPDGLLAGGMFARATIASGPSQQAVCVPIDAIVQHDGISYVGMVMPGHKGGMNGMRMPVTLGLEVDDWITITSGNVRPGAGVVVRGTEYIMPFPAPVEIVDESGTPVGNPPAVAMPGSHGKPSDEEGA